MDHLCVKCDFGMSVFKIDSVFTYGAIMRPGFAERKKENIFHYKGCKIHIYLYIYKGFKAYVSIRTVVTPDTVAISFQSISRA
jgi:hypothetical protein